MHYNQHPFLFNPDNRSTLIVEHQWLPRWTAAFVRWFISLSTANSVSDPLIYDESTLIRTGLDHIEFDDIYSIGDGNKHVRRAGRALPNFL